MRRSVRPADPASLRAACYDFLARPEVLQSTFARDLQEALKVGALDRIAAWAAVAEWEQKAGLGTWVPGLGVSR